MIKPLQKQRAHSLVSLRRRLAEGSLDLEKRKQRKSQTQITFRTKLQRLIKEEKAQEIVSADPHSKANLFYNNHVSEMEKELSSTKKSLSTMVLKARAREQSIALIKNQMARAEKEIILLKKEDTSIHKHKDHTSTTLENKKETLQITHWEHKCHEHMKERLSQDQLTQKTRHQRLNDQLNQQLHAERLLNKIRIEQGHQLKRLNELLQEARLISNKKTQEKNELISLMNEDMNERGLLDELKIDKHKREEHINEIASSLIEQEELEKMLEILLTHRMLAQIIKTKSLTLIAKYQEVHKAYMHIKSHSNITDCDKILKRMDEHDALYDGALKRATILEQQLNQVEKQVKESTKHKEQILSKEGVSKVREKGYYQGKEKDKYQLLLSEKEKVLSRIKSDEVLRRNIQNWARTRFQDTNVKESTDFLTSLTDLTIRIQQRI